MKNRCHLLKKALAILLSFTFVVPVFTALIGDSGSAQAAVSLPYVEKLKKSGDTFNILEILPDASKGSIGYYIEGQEPCANWASEAANKTKDDRSAYVNALFTALSSAGLLGTSDSAPLEKTVLADGSLYKECFPWDPHDGFTRMNLDHEEDTTLSLGLSPVEDGEFVQSGNEFEFGVDGAYVQVIDYFAATTENPKGSDRYYYAPVFEPVGAVGGPEDKRAIYTNDAPDGVVSHGHYVYEGTLGAADFPGLEIGKSYYYVERYGAPSQIKDDFHPYVAASSAFELKGDKIGYFNPKGNVMTYRYVGSGGDFDRDPDAAIITTKIIYRSVYYQGGFKNNNWFLRYVLDWETSEVEPTVSFNVISVSSADLLDAADPRISGANLIVLSRAYGQNGTATDFTYDISDPVKAAILAESTTVGTEKGVPVIVDSALRNSSQPNNIRALATSLTAANNLSDFVKDNIYCHATPLATASFHDLISGTHSDANAPFYEVYKTITYENFLRGISGGVPLPVTITMASAVRHIINFTGARYTGSKTKINVLEIEPGRGSQITKAAIRAWLGNPSGLLENDISITAMSTAEFIGKIDKVSELYDLVYIGSDLTGFKTKTVSSVAVPDYNDNDMDGLIYTSIGDTVIAGEKSGYDCSGLLNRDYASNGAISALVASRTFRYSGNDLTTAKQSELLAFVNAGYPVVLADKLLTGGSSAAEVKFSVTVSASQSGGTVTMKATPAALNGGTLPDNLTYQWYNNDTLVDTSTSADKTSLAVTPDVNGAVPYYCKVTNGAADCTPAKSNTITVTRTSSLFADNNNTRRGAVVNAYTNTITYTLGMNCSHDKINESNTFAVTSDPALPAGTTYEWLYWKNNGSNQVVQRKSTNSQYTTTSNHNSEYYCRVYLPNQSYYGYTLDYYYDKNVPGFVSNGTQLPPTATFTTNLSVNVNAEAPLGNYIPLTASMSPTVSGTFAYKWYSNDIYSSSATTINATLGNSYTCRLYSGATYLSYSDTYTIKSIASVTQVSNSVGKTDGTIPGTTAIPSNVNPDTVDTCSRMYALLNAISSKPNVKTVSDLNTTANQNQLKQFVDLAKPEIIFSVKNNKSLYPTEYSMNTANVMNFLDANTDGSYYLDYTFRIENDTDPDPANTRYICNLYTDNNADGLYSDAELLPDILVRECDSSRGTVGARVGINELRSGVEYYVSRKMPADKVGIIPWKLQIVKVGGQRTSTSIQKYTRIAPTDSQVTTINILQINQSGGLNLSTNATYKRLLDAVGDFRVHIFTITTDQINALTTTAYTYNPQTFSFDYVDTQGNNVLNTCIGSGYPEGKAISALQYLKDEKFTPASGLSNETLKDALFNQFDMLILGFKDSYQELNLDTSRAIASYIETGKATLFSHDCTSYYFTPNGTRTSTGNYVYNDLTSDHGYNFNQTIRDSVSLDVYGVTNIHFGLSSSRPDLFDSTRVSGDGIVADSDRYVFSTSVANSLSTIVSGETLSTAKRLERAGYSIAYKPKSGTWTGSDFVSALTVPETQGLSKALLLKKYVSGGSPTSISNDISKTSDWSGTTHVSQVNKGQLTTYPYNINTLAFGGSSSLSNLTTNASNKIDIAYTHNQYFQLNMNADDIVVWYCLADTAGLYSYLPNDVVNDYYIYSCGNVTYTGFGHTSDSVNENEAKLFVNTMIAAYRIAQVSPVVKFSDASGKLSLANFLMTADEDGVLSFTGANDATRNIHFTVTDPSIGASKMTRVRFSYGDSTEQLTLPVYNAETNAELSSEESLVSGLTYYIKVDDLWARLPLNVQNTIGNGIAITITASTSIGGNTKTGTTSLTLRSLMLFALG